VRPGDRSVDNANLPKIRIVSQLAEHAKIEKRFAVLHADFTDGEYKL
jgi:hypothetical protein